MDSVETKKWLERLPRFNCSVCGKASVFRSGCPQCEERGEIQEERAALLRELNFVTSQIDSLEMRKAELRLSLALLGHQTSLKNHSRRSEK